MLVVLKLLIQYQTPRAIRSVQSVRSAMPFICIRSEGLTPFEGLLPSRILCIFVEHPTIFFNLSDQVCYINQIYAHVTKEQYLYYHLVEYKDIRITGMHCYMTFTSSKDQSDYFTNKMSATHPSSPPLEKKKRTH